MGAAQFSNYVSKKTAPTIDVAFRLAQEEARWESGHGGYTGTIAEKHSFQLVRSDAVTPRQAQRISAEMFDNDDARVADKWGPAAALIVEDETRSGWLFFGYASE